MHWTAILPLLWPVLATAIVVPLDPRKPQDGECGHVEFLHDTKGNGFEPQAKDNKCHLPEMSRYLDVVFVRKGCTCEYYRSPVCNPAGLFNRYTGEYTHNLGLDGMYLSYKCFQAG